MKVNCIECGGKIEDTDLECEHCGAAQEVDVAELPAPSFPTAAIAASGLLDATRVCCHPRRRPPGAAPEPQLRRCCLTVRRHRAAVRRPPRPPPSAHPSAAPPPLSREPLPGAVPPPPTEPLWRDAPPLPPSPCLHGVRPALPPQDRSAPDAERRALSRRGPRRRRRPRRRRATSPNPFPLVGNLPADLVAVCALMALAGVLMLIPALRVIPDMLDLLTSGDGLGRSLGLLLATVWIVLAFFGGSCLFLAWRLTQSDRVARGLSYVLLGSLALSLLFSSDATGLTVVALLSAAAGLVLAFSPGS